MDITQENTRVADALVRVYFAGASKAMSLHEMALVTAVPLSDLYGAIQRHWQTIPRGARPTKRCGHCNEEMLVADFGKDDSRKDGLAHRCKRCRREQDRKRRAA